jgi:hypothetical protein
MSGKCPVCDQLAFVIVQPSTVAQSFLSKRSSQFKGRKVTHASSPLPEFSALILGPFPLTGDAFVRTAWTAVLEQ